MSLDFSLTSNPSDRTMALGSTQPLTEMSIRSISWGKGGRCVRLTTVPLSCAVVVKFGNLNFLEPSGPLQACNGAALPLRKTCTSFSILTSDFGRKKSDKNKSFAHYKVDGPMNIINCLRPQTPYIRFSLLQTVLSVEMQFLSPF